MVCVDPVVLFHVNPPPPPEAVIVTVDPLAVVVIPVPPAMVNALLDTVAVPDPDINDVAPEPVNVTVDPVAVVVIPPAPVKVTVVPVADPVVASKVTIP
jgi:hypothetical protein